MSEEKVTKRRRSKKAEVEDVITTEEVSVVEAETADTAEADTVSEITSEIDESAPAEIEQVSEPVVELPPVENTAAIQEVAESAPVKKSKKEKKSDPLAIGTELHLIDTKSPAKLYFKSNSVRFIRFIAGTVYIWGETDNGRIPVTDNQELIGNAHGLIGWIDISAIGE